MRSTKCSHGLRASFDLRFTICCAVFRATTRVAPTFSLSFTIYDLEPQFRATARVAPTFSLSFTIYDLEPQFRATAFVCYGRPYFLFLPINKFLM